MVGEKTLEIRLFGALDFRLNGVSQHLALAGATRSLLQYLLCFHGRPNRRETLVEMFWPEVRSDRRRSSLNSAIWRIKKALAPFPALEVEATPDCIRLDGADSPEVDIDIRRLENAQSRAAEGDPSAVDLASLLGALQNCEATPLEGLEDGWAGIERERLNALRLRAMTTAMQGLAERRRYDEALEIGRRILLLDPYRECAFQEVMCLYVLNGERARAMQIYDEFRSTLDAELGIAPMTETMVLREYLASDQCRNPSRDRPVAASLLEYASRPGVSALLSAIENTRHALRHSVPAAAH